MLTIAEEFVLLALDGRTGDFRKIQTEYLHAGVLGAALMQLALADEFGLHVFDCTNTGSAIAGAYVA